MDREPARPLHKLLVSRQTGCHRFDRPPWCSRGNRDAARLLRPTKQARVPVRSRRSATAVTRRCS
jgi:hypothetical protein